MTGRTRKILTAILLVVFLFSIVKFLQGQMDKSAGSSTYQDALQMATSEKNPAAIQTVPPTGPEHAEEAKPRWIPAPVEEEDPNLQTLESIGLDSLQEAHPDVVGWILIPDTQVNYPLMQGEDNEYYLNRTWDGKNNSVGSIFLESQNSPDLTDFNTIVYGHNMMDGSMFATVRQYGVADYWEKHPYVYILSQEGIFRYEVFASYQAPVDSSTYGLSFNQAKTRINFLTEAMDNSVISTGIVPALTDRILTLSTCSGAGYTHRWVVHARLKMIQTAS